MSTSFKVKSLIWILWKKMTISLWWKILLLLYIAFPLTIKAFPGIFLNMVFSHHVRSLVLTQLGKPKEAWGVSGCSNFNIKSSSGNKIGIWHIPPAESNDSLKGATNVILYCHGKRGHRGSGHRLPFYETLRKLNFHIVTFDYSGFGDSEGSPNGKNVVEDTITVYKWCLKQISPDAVLLVWGHSLGSAISTLALKTTTKDQHLKKPAGFILEAPFTNLQDAIHTHPTAKVMFRLWPYVMNYIMRDICEEYDITFPIDTYLTNLNTHILILHSDSDPKIKVEFSEHLYETIAENQETKAKSIKLVRFDKKYDLGHSDIYQSPHIATIIKQFRADVDKDNYGGFISNKVFI